MWNVLQHFPFKIIKYLYAIVSISLHAKSKKSVDSRKSIEFEFLRFIIELIWFINTGKIEMIT